MTEKRTAEMNCPPLPLPFNHVLSVGRCSVTSPVFWSHSLIPGTVPMTICIALLGLCALRCPRLGTRPAPLLLLDLVVAPGLCLGSLTFSSCQSWRSQGKTGDKLSCHNSVSCFHVQPPYEMYIQVYVTA
jgi:hypothetical protein